MNQQRVGRRPFVRRMAQVEPASLSAMAIKLAEPALDHPRSRAQQLWRYWREAVGPAISQHTEPVRASDGLLTVRVDSAAWVTELGFMKPELLAKLKTVVPESLAVQDLHFRQESLRWRLPEQQERSVWHFPSPIPEEERRADTLVAMIHDQPLRETLRRILLKLMARDRAKLKAGS